MKKIVITIIQFVVTIALLIWVFHDHEQRAKMAKALQAADLRWVAAAIIAYVTVEIAAAIRWQILLRVQGIRLNFFRLVGLFLIGMFYNQFLPGGTGGGSLYKYMCHYGAAAHGAPFAPFLFVAYALHAEDVRKQPPAPVPAVDFFAVMPIERTITAVPISLAGIGLREKLLQVMLNNLCGVTIEKSKLIGSLGFLVIMICCAPGGLVYFFYKPSGVAKRVRLREMEREVATAEHEIPEPK